MENMDQNQDLEVLPDVKLKFNLSNCTSSTHVLMLRKLALPLVNRLEKLKLHFSDEKCKQSKDLSVLASTWKRSTWELRLKKVTEKLR